MRLPQTYTPSPSELAQNQYAFDLWRNDPNSDDLFHQHLLNAFRVAITEELTEQQRTYIIAYYYERLTMDEIAERFAVNKSTVSRTINRARKRLERVLRYASPSLLKKGYNIGTRKANRKKRLKNLEVSYDSRKNNI